MISTEAPPPAYRIPEPRPRTPRHRVRLARSLGAQLRPDVDFAIALVADGEHDVRTANARCDAAAQALERQSRAFALSLAEREIVRGASHLAELEHFVGEALFVDALHGASYDTIDGRPAVYADDLLQAAAATRRVARRVARGVAGSGARRRTNGASGRPAGPRSCRTATSTASNGDGDPEPASRPQADGWRRAVAA